MTLRIGHISYANCTPLFTSLKDGECSDYQFVPGFPALLNEKLRTGEVDVSPSSSITYAMDADKFMLLPDLSISSIGRVKSVFLFSTVPIETLQSAAVGLSTESDTSVALLKILLRVFYGFNNSFVRTGKPLDEAVKEFPAVLLIGDNALKGRMLRGDLFVYDLGELWYHFTRLPFVFALWIVRREAVEKRRDEVLRLHARLVAAKKHALENLEQIFERCPERGWMQKEDLVDYWRTISYDLTPLHIEGVQSFFRHAADIGVLEKAPQLSFVK